MISLKVDFTAFNKSLDELVKYHRELFTTMAVTLARDILVRLIRKTKIGDPSRIAEGGAYAQLYEERQATKGYDVRVGLAKGSWITELNTVTPEGAALYDSNNTNVALRTTFETEMKNFKLGDVINLHNSLDYITEDAEGDVAIAETFAASSRIINSAIRKSYRGMGKIAVKNVRGA